MAGRVVDRNAIWLSCRTVQQDVVAFLVRLHGVGAAGRDEYYEGMMLFPAGQVPPVSLLRIGLAEALHLDVARVEVLHVEIIERLPSCEEVGRYEEVC